MLTINIVTVLLLNKMKAKQKKHVMVYNKKITHTIIKNLRYIFLTARLLACTFNIEILGSSFEY